MQWFVNSKTGKSLLLFLLFITAFLLFSPGLTGSFYYDDIRPFTNLAKVSDVSSALIYIFTETSGPLGRPVSMLSYLFEHYLWPQNKQAVFSVNIIIHSLNGVLVSTFSYLLLSLFAKQNNHTISTAGISKAQQQLFLVSFFTGFLWLVLPIHAATVLIAIQRMTELSAFFILIGLNCYLFGLHKQSTFYYNNKKQAKSKDFTFIEDGLFYQLIGIILCTLFAMFSKENGVLLPVFIFVMEITLLRAISSIEYRRHYRLIGSGIGLLIILVYLVFYVINTGNHPAGRDFTLFQRIITQPQILIDYLQLTLLPSVNAIHPFYDNYSKQDSLFNFQVVLSLLTVIAAFVFAIVKRKKKPLFSFAVLWFLAAHLLESTTISLELYFLHRNYLAVIGICILISYLVINCQPRLKELVQLFFLLYISFLVFILLQVSSLWGKPNEAAVQWSSTQIGSSRASENLAVIAFNNNRFDVAYSTMLKQVAACPTCTASVARALFFSCLANNVEQTSMLYQKLNALKPSALRTRALPATFRQISTAITNKDCKLISKEQIKALNISYLTAPDSPFNKNLGFLQNLYIIGLEAKDVNGALNWLQLAWQEQQDYGIANELISMYLAQAQLTKAQLVYEQYCQHNNNWPISLQKDKQCLLLKKRTTL